MTFHTVLLPLKYHETSLRLTIWHIWVLKFGCWIHVSTRSLEEANNRISKLTLLNPVVLFEHSL